MPPKSTGKKPTRRSTRAISRARSFSSDPALEESGGQGGGARIRGQELYEEPRRQNPPGLHTAHDGSYGSNTLSPANDGLGRSRKLKPKFVKEDEEDDRFMREVLGKNATKKPAAKSGTTSRLSSAMNEVQESRMVDEAMASIEDPDDVADSLGDELEYARPNGSTQGQGPSDTAQHPLDPDDGDLWDESAFENSPRNPYRSELPNPNRTPQLQRRHPSEPPSSMVARYGAPTGRASSVPLSPARSYRHESSLFEKASLHTPVPNHRGPLGDITEETHGANAQGNVQNNNNNGLGRPLFPLDAGFRIPPRNPDITSFKPARPLPNGKQNSKPTQGNLDRGNTLRNGQVDQRFTQGAPSGDQKKNSTRAETNPNGLSKGGLLNHGEHIRDPDHDRLNNFDTFNVNEDRPAVQNNMMRPERNNVEGRRRGPIEEERRGVSEVQAAAGRAAAEAVSAELGARENRSYSARPVMAGTDAAREAKNSPNGNPSAHGVHDDQNGPRGRGHRSMPREIPSWTDKENWSHYAKVFVGITVLLWLAINLLGGNGDPADEDPFGNRTGWQGWSNVKNGVARYIPTSIRHPLRSLGDVNVQTIFDRLDAHDTSIQALQNWAKINGRRIQGLESRMPSLLRVEHGRDGKLKIPDEFFHALKDLTSAGDAFLVLENARGSSPKISDQHWRAVRQRLESDGSLKLPADGSRSSISRQEIDSVLDTALPRRWESYIKENQAALLEALGPALANQVPGMSEKDIKAHIEKTLKDDPTSSFVSRNEFMSILQEHLDRSDVRSQLKDINARIKAYEKELMNQNGEAASGSLPRSEIEAIVQAAVRKANHDAAIEAVATVGIREELKVLERGRNYFDKGLGAATDPNLSSPTRQSPKPRYMSQEWWWGLNRGIEQYGPGIVRDPWNGDVSRRFCAGPDLSGHGAQTNNVSMLVARDITPTKLVIEHALPGATLDAGAMPREVEVWAALDDVNMRQAAEAWSARKHPHFRRSDNALEENYVKLAEFEYRREYTGDGVQIFPFDAELLTLRISSQSFVVKAVSNYGADYTCFYRLRMYGDESR